MDNSGEACAIVLDISKAFDRLCHSVLFHKLSAYSVKCEVFDTVKSFLDQCKLSLKLDGSVTSK